MTLLQRNLSISLRTLGSAGICACAIGVICCFGGNRATGGVLNPIVAGSIRDEPIDGLGDVVESFDPGLLRLVPDNDNVENRAIAEFDLTGISPGQLTAADLAFTLHYNNGIDPTNRQFNVSIYSGNGAVDVSDFQIPATILGQFTLFTPDFSPVTYSGESILSLVQGVLSGGASFVGVRFEPVGAVNPPSIVTDISLTIATVPEPSSFVLAALGAIGIVTTGRRRNWYWVFETSSGGDRTLLAKGWAGRFRAAWNYLRCYSIPSSCDG